ncbi:MAG: protein kinase [Myxococcales bacterium]|nr:protein kinase [Myxococcales bacterium]
MSPEPFGEYRLLEKVAESATGELFRAVRAGAPEPLALERMHPELSRDAGFREVFLSDAEVAKGLSHECIASVAAIGERNGRLFLARPWVEGVSLEELLPRAIEEKLAPFSAGLAARLVLPVSRALRHAHSQKVLHRGVSLSNVLVSFDGEVKLAGFGMARARLRVAGAARPFLSPEQARGREVDARSDVFAAGATLYALACGRLPVQGDEGDRLSRIATGELDPPREANPSIDPQLEGVLQRALALSPDGRPSSEELTSALEELARREQADGPAKVVSQLFPDRKRPRRGQAAQAIASAPAQSPRADRPRAGPFRIWPWALLGAAGLVAGGYWLERPEPTYSLLVTSEPAGAQVLVDGKLRTGATPLTLQGLSADRHRRIELVASGYLPFSRELEPSMKHLHARLEARGSPAEAKEPAAMAPIPSAEGVAFDAEAPPVKVTLSSRRHSVHIPSSRALRIPLNLLSHYTVSASGSATLDLVDPALAAQQSGRGRSPPFDQDSRKRSGAWRPEAPRPPGLISILRPEARRIFYMLEQPPAHGGESFGQLGGSAVKVGRATLLYAFLLTDRAQQYNAGTFQVAVVSEDGKEVYLLDAREHAVYVAPEDRFLIRRLDPEASYRIGLSSDGAAAVAAVFTPDGSRPLWLDGSPTAETQHLLGTGRHTLSGAKSLWLTLPLLGQEENSAAGIELEVARLASQPPR